METSLRLQMSISSFIVSERVRAVNFKKFGFELKNLSDKRMVIKKAPMKGLFAHQSMT
jgi:hypothetical protein